MNPTSARRLLAGLALTIGLAGPAHANIITVNSAADITADDGECTLREAINAANTNNASGSDPRECAAGTHQDPNMPDDVIAFDIPGTGPFIIHPIKPLPEVTEAVLIDGYSQRGAKPNSLPVGSNAVLMLELSTAWMSAVCDVSGMSPVSGAGFQFAGASGSRLRGFAITALHQHHDAGVVIFQASGVQIDGNFIGFDTGGKAVENEVSYGIFVMNGRGEMYPRWPEPPGIPIDDGGAGNLIGGPSPQERNVIGGGGTAIFLAGQGNRVEGNYLGVDPQGLGSFPGKSHVLIAGHAIVGSCALPQMAYHYAGQDNTIGGGARGVGNLFSADWPSCAVMLGASGNLVQGNWMGTDRTGSLGSSGQGLGVQMGCGVLVEGGGADNNTIARNTIVMGTNGVVVRASSGPGVPLGNNIEANSIYMHTRLGIDLGNDDVTDNDQDDQDKGPNDQQNFPEHLKATVMGVRGDVRGKPNVEQRIDFFQSVRCHNFGHGEGEKYLGSTSVVTDPNGKASFSVSVRGLEMERRVTATATTVADGTSEFSECATVMPGSSLTVETRSSRSRARSHETFQIFVLARGFGGNRPTGRVQLVDLNRPTPATGSIPAGFEVIADASLSSGSGDTAVAVVDSTTLQLRGSLWGNIRMRAQYLGDSTYGPASSADFVQTIYREKSDLSGDGFTDLVLCDAANEKFQVLTPHGSFTAPGPLPQLDATRVVLGTAEFGRPQESAVVWRDASGVIGGTRFDHGQVAEDFDIPLRSGYTFEALGSMFGDLKDDFIVRGQVDPATGRSQHYAVLTNGLGPDQLGLLDPIEVDRPNDYVVEQVGDFNGDGQTDWYLFNATLRAHAMWLLDGHFHVAARGALPAPTFPAAGGGTAVGTRIVATGDFNGDGQTDLVWQLSDGDLALVMQTGIMNLAQIRLSALVGPGKPVVGTGFFNDGTGTGGGRSSLVLQDLATDTLEAWINTGVDRDPNTGVSTNLPIFGQHQTLIGTGGMKPCVP
jgi:CSLREA domain-containing protein